MADTSNRTAWRIFFILIGAMVVVMGAETWAIASMHNQLDTIRREQVAVNLGRPGIAHNRFVKAMHRMFWHPRAGDNAGAQSLNVEPIEQAGWTPWLDAVRREHQVEQTFANFFERMGQTPMATSFDMLGVGWVEPRLELKEDTNRYIVSADIPGATEDNVDVSVHSRQLTISGTRETEEHQTNPDGTVLWNERRMGHFERTVTLPGPVDESRMSVTIHDGVLEVTLPKAA